MKVVDLIAHLSTLSPDLDVKDDEGQPVDVTPGVVEIRVEQEADLAQYREKGWKIRYFSGMPDAVSDEYRRKQFWIVEQPVIFII